jgi:PD-(D/E)XK nuclease superfamily
MKWSISSSKTFAQCPRKWYYNSVYAKSRDTDNKRREAFILKKLQNVNTWRGKLVDQVITSFIIPKLRRKVSIDEEDVIRYAQFLFNSQLQYAKAKTYRTVDLNSAVCAGLYFSALFEFEYGEGPSDAELSNAKAEVETSLRNFLHSSMFAELQTLAHDFIAQRPLQFRLGEDVNVSCTPDLIVFFKDKPPVIVDWKVFFSTYKESWLQLGAYGLALSRVVPHKDFAPEWSLTRADPTSTRLVEFQLLRNRRLEYEITQEDMIDVEDYIYTSSSRMRMVLNGHSSARAPTVSMIPTTMSPETCMSCKFRKICWSGASR